MQAPLLGLQLDADSTNKTVLDLLDDELDITKRYTVSGHWLLV